MNKLPLRGWGDAEHAGRTGEAGPQEPDHALLSVEQLFAGRRELRLQMGNEEYRLRITRNDKLILTK